MYLNINYLFNFKNISETSIVHIYVEINKITRTNCKFKYTIINLTENKSIYGIFLPNKEFIQVSSICEFIMLLNINYNR